MTKLTTLTLASILVAEVASGSGQLPAAYKTLSVIGIQQNKNSNSGMDDLLYRIRVNVQPQITLQEDKDGARKTVLLYEASGYNQDLRSMVTFIYIDNGKDSTLRTILHDTQYTSSASVIPEGKENERREGKAYLTFLETEGVGIDGKPEIVGMYIVYNNDTIRYGIDIPLTPIDARLNTPQERVNMYQNAVKTEIDTKAK